MFGLVPASANCRFFASGGVAAPFLGVQSGRFAAVFALLAVNASGLKSLR